MSDELRQTAGRSRRGIVTRPRFSAAADDITLQARMIMHAMLILALETELDRHDKSETKRARRSANQR